MMIRILIADDHPIVRRGLRDILGSEFERLTVGEAGDARQTMRLLEREKWDLLLLDINLPDRSGLDLLADIKKLRPRMPVLMLSVHPEKEFAFRALKLGAAGYLDKQSAPEELAAAAKKALGGGKYVSSALAEQLAASLDGGMQNAPHEALSPRELEVLRLVASGKTAKEIAALLSLSEKTIGTYRARISSKLNLSTNVELARYALRHGLVD